MTKEENVAQINESIKKCLDGYNNFAIISWNTENNRGYETMTKYSMMSNVDSQSALMCVDAIVSIMVENMTKERITSDA